MSLVVHLVDYRARYVHYLVDGITLLTLGLYIPAFSGEERGSLPSQNKPL